MLQAGLPWQASPPENRSHGLMSLIFGPAFALIFCDETRKIHLQIFDDALINTAIPYGAKLDKAPTGAA
jgi:hypothetical protein